MNGRVGFGSMCFLCAVVAAATSTHGAVFERDWKAVGDGLLTYDDVNRREWLDLTLQGDLPTPRYEHALAETVPGGIFEGFVVADREDVIDLAESAGVTIGSLDFDLNAVATERLIELLDVVSSSTNGFKSTRGLIDEIDAQNALRYAALINFSPVGKSAGLTIVSRSDGVSHAGLPVYLYRSAVPEPTSAVSASSLAVLLFLSLRKRW
jgi:hypothetical protein